jgi:hypothetical protein
VNANRSLIASSCFLPLPPPPTHCRSMVNHRRGRSRQPVDREARGRHRPGPRPDPFKDSGSRAAARRRRACCYLPLSLSLSSPFAVKLPFSAVDTSCPFTDHPQAKVVRFGFQVGPSRDPLSLHALSYMACFTSLGLFPFLLSFCLFSSIRSAFIHGFSLTFLRSSIPEDCSSGDGQKDTDASHLGR